jgi:hypothetical protein
VFIVVVLTNTNNQLKEYILKNCIGVAGLIGVLCLQPSWERYSADDLLWEIQICSSATPAVSMLAMVNGNTVL